MPLPGERRPHYRAYHHLIADFYKEEFLKHRQCLESQREFYSDRAIDQLERALERLVAQLDTLCVKDNADQMLGGLLRKLDVVTRLSMLSGWSDHPRTLH
jgi:hypothetical protein